jgi:hypothetical protein
VKVRVALTVDIPDEGLGYIDTAPAVPRKAEVRRIVRQGVLSYAEAIPWLIEAEAVVTMAG